MSVTLHIEMLSHWRAGTGRNRAGAFDATCQRDPDQLPMIPGKHLRGLLREALREANVLGWTGVSEIDLFGTRPTGSEPDGKTAKDPQDGVLRIESARLPKADRAALLAQPDLIPFLFATRRSTRISRDTGAAAKGSLRFDEVAVPVMLTARLTAEANAHPGWAEAIETALPLLRAIGANRSRGLGRCIVTMVREGGS